MLRPLSGEPFAEFIERAGNYGAPLALLLLTHSANNKWLKTISTERSSSMNNQSGGYNLFAHCGVPAFLGSWLVESHRKKSLLDQYRSLGFSNPVSVAHIVGSLEILAAVSTLIKPVHSILIIFFAWKMFSELFYPHWEVFEFIERGEVMAQYSPYGFLQNHLLNFILIANKNIQLLKQFYKYR
jgi:hypothetical protein